jgi:hypothetical protein
MYKIPSIILILIPCVALASDRPPYSGEQLRSIKSLSEQQIESLRRGDGMGFAKLAELNHFPGPKHVLDISDELALSPHQIAETKSLYEEMLRGAIALGEKILVAESQLDGNFEQGSIDPESLETALLEISRLQADLRYIHLHAHLREKQLLKPEQIQVYDSVRGYSVTGDHGEHAIKHE